MGVNIIHATYPSDELVDHNIKTSHEEGREIHCLNVMVEPDISEPSIEDIYTTLVPLGCHVQCIIVRYQNHTERALVNISSVLTRVDSVHFIAPVISKEEIERVDGVIKSGIHFKLRMTGSIKDNNLCVPEKTPGSNYITINKCKDTIVVVSEPNMESRSKPLDISDEGLVTLSEKDSLVYISQNS